MTITASTITELPPFPRLLNLRPRPESVSHPGLRALTEQMCAARKAAGDAIAEHERLNELHLLDQAHNADVSALQGAASSGDYTDPGTPNVDALLAERAAAHRKAYALQVRAAELIREWLDYLNEHLDEITEYVNKPRQQAARKAAATVSKALTDIRAVHAADAELAWLRNALDDPSANRIGPKGQYFVSAGPRPADSPILAQVEGLLAALDNTPPTGEAAA